MSRQQILRELTANDFQLVREFPDLPWQHMLFFGRAGSAGPQRGETGGQHTP
jgi:hypothetical protein